MLLIDPTFMFIKRFLQAYLFCLPDMVNHLVISNCKQIALALLIVHLLTVEPHFFKRSLYNILCIFCMAQVFEDKAINIIRIQIYTIVVFSLCHTVLGVIKLCDRPYLSAKTQRKG